jgi:hypothetical protein
VVGCYFFIRKRVNAPPTQKTNKTRGGGPPNGSAKRWSKTARSRRA